MTASIPASEIVQILPGVIGAGGNALDLSGLVLTNSTRAPVGAVLPFASLPAVQSYFGPSSTEASLAAIYFAGFDGATQTPGAMLFAQYPTADVAAWLRGGSLTGMTLAQLKALTGVLTINVNGSPLTSTSINLSAAASFSNAATIIQAAFTSPPFTVSYDSLSNAFVFTSTTAGVASTITFPTGTLSAGLLLTAVTGAATSQGAIAGVPATAMDAIVAQTVNWASFMTAFAPSISDMVAFSAWNNGKNNRFAYIMWDTSAAPTTNTDTTSAGYLIGQAGYSGTVRDYAPVNTANAAAFIMGSIASIDFNAENGRTNLAFRSQAGLAADVSNQVIAENLLANGYNFYGQYATANQGFVFFYNGSITGKFAWLDSYVNQMWMNNSFQLALMSLLTSPIIRTLPYNAAGYGLVETAMADTVNAGLDFGAIQTGVVLSALQAAEVNAAAGLKIDDTLMQRGWYISCTDPGAQVRAARGTPSIIFFYMDGGSIQKIVLSSDLVQ